MFGVNDLITKINTAIGSGTATEDEIELLSVAVESLRLYDVASVATPAALPNPVTNRGRFFFIQSTNSYTFSNGVAWNINGILRQNVATLWAWGNNGYGRLGDGTTGTKSSPVSVVGGFTDWVDVSAGSNHTVAIRASGTAWAWGANTPGQLGNGTSGVYRTSPVSVVGGFTDWTQISAGTLYSVGIRANGTAWAWGANNSGTLGDNTTVSKSSPVSVVGGFTNWVQVSAGSGHAAGIRANGSAWAWGNGNGGRLGDNSEIAKSSPVSVVGGFVDWVQISAGGGTAAIRANGTAWAWGSNGSGQLGDGTATARSSPVLVVGGFTDWVQISAALSHTVGVRANGTAWAWGFNDSGRLGDDTSITRSSPVSVVGGFTDWVQVRAGNYHTVGVRANGTAWAWGRNNYASSGAIGDNTIVNKSSPVSVVGGFTDWVQVSAGNGHSMGLRAT